MERVKLEGKKIDKLYVDRYIGNGKYLCKCDCGKEVEVFGTNLKSHHTTSCGCTRAYANLTDKVFGYLKAIKRAEGKQRGDIKRVMWECKCLRCGAIIKVYADSLQSGFTTSCGCINTDKSMPQAIIDDFVDGTQLSKIQSKPTKANKSGVVGVNWDKSRSKWQASIRFKGHKYNLGRFKTKEEAAEVRKIAEGKLFGDFLKWYEEEYKNT